MRASLALILCFAWAQATAGQGHALDGEVRLRLVAQDPPGFGLPARPGEGFGLLRLRLGWQPQFGAHGRARVEIGSHFAPGKSDPGPRDANRLDLHQGWLGYERHGWLLRAGRQEFLYGAGRLIGPRNAANVRTSFDGLRLAAPLARHSLEAFAARALDLRDERVFDDRADAGERVVGLALSAEVDGFEALWLQRRRDQGRVAGRRAAERRDSLSLRWAGRASGWLGSAEAVWQGGRLGPEQIRAHWLILVAGRPLGEDAGVRLRFDLASGDGGQPGRVGTLDGIYNGGAYFGLAAPLAAANLLRTGIELHSGGPALGRYRLFVDDFRRHRLSDGVYTGGYRLLPNTAEARSRSIGQQVRLRGEWPLQAGWSLAVEGSWFARGSGLREAGGRDAGYLGIELGRDFLR